MNPGLKAALRSLVRALALPVARRAARHKRVRRMARALLGRMPIVERRLKTLLAQPEPLPPRRMHVPLDSADLSPATQRLYQELKRRFETRKS